MHRILTFLLCLILAVPAHAVSLISDTEIETFVTELIAPIGAAANIAPGRLRVHIVNDDDFNAFVMGGEDVYLYTGLITRIKSPDALVAVVAHEMGHTIGGHMAQMSDRMAAEMKRMLLIQALGIGLMVAGGTPSFGAGIMAGGSGIATQSMLAFSRDEERIADNLGLDLMVRANINPNGFIDVFEQMRDITGAAEEKINPNKINHPLTSERLANVRARIAEIKKKDWKKTPKSTVARYALVRAKLVGYLDSQSRIQTLYPDTDASDAAIYARAIAAMRAGDLVGAANAARKLISHDNKNPYFYEFLGDVEYQAGNYDAAIDAYARALKIIDNAPQIQTAMAMALVARGGANDTARALELCRRALLRDAAPLTYWVMSMAFADDAGRADWARAEYYAMMGDNKNAKKYAKMAQKQLEKDTPEYIKSGDIISE